MTAARLRILHVVPTYLPAVRYGGPIYSVHGLCRATVEQGHDVHVFTTNVDGANDSDVPLETPVDIDGVKIWYFRSRLLRRLYYAPRLAQVLKKQVREFDVIHLHSVFLWPTWAAARAARRASVPYVLSPRGMLDKKLVRRRSRWLKVLWIKLIERCNLEQAVIIHVTSSIEETELRKFGFRLRDLVQIPNGTEWPVNSEDKEIGDDVRAIIGNGDYVLYLGRIHWKKGLDRLIEAWAEVGDHRLVIAGTDEEGYAGKLRSRVSSGAAERIAFVPRTVTGSDKEALYAHACLFVLPSYSENFGNTVLEAMARGVPVLVTPQVGAAEVVKQSGGGLVVEGADLAVGIRRILSPTEDVAVLGWRGRNYVENHCSWSATAQKMSQVYASCVRRANQGSNEA